MSACQNRSFKSIMGMNCEYSKCGFSELWQRLLGKLRNEVWRLWCSVSSLRQSAELMVASRRHMTALHASCQSRVVMMLCCAFVCTGAYFCMNMILITLSMFLAVVIIQTHIRGDRKNKVPTWLKRVINT